MHFDQVYAQSLYGTVVLDGDSWLVYWLDRALRHGLRIERHGYWGTARELSHQDTVVVIHALQSVLTSIGKGTLKYILMQKFIVQEKILIKQFYISFRSSMALPHS